MASAILFMSLLVNFFEHYLPSTIIQTFRYGKFSYTGRRSYINYLEVPKRWFKHFYVIATVYLTIILYLLFSAYCLSRPAPRGLKDLFDVIATKERTVSVNATTAALATVLLCCQVWRRFYETFMISVFSDCKINIVHYLIGIAHYLGAATALIVEAPGFSTPSFKHKATLSVWDLMNARSIFGPMIFFWAWYHQYRSAVILANLRKDEKGTVVTYEHRLPVGGLFDRLSSPHMFCEVIMYFALNLILWGHTIWPYVFFWVLCNQCETALLNHWWYKSHFKAYPKQRKAFLPFLF